jgi:ATP phosphoribosyltransferase
LAAGIQPSAREILPLGFARSQFRFAARTAKDLADLHDTRIATSYPNLVGNYLTKHGVTAELVRLDGAVENAIALGVADTIADVVCTGASLHKAGLVPFGNALMESEAILTRSPHSLPPEKENAVKTLTQRLQGALDARISLGQNARTTPTRGRRTALADRDVDATAPQPDRDHVIVHPHQPQPLPPARH